jgi:L-threonylcarbamoyladenylate synthase
LATDLIEIDQERPAGEAIARAAGLIRRGGVVAIPTDALYVLAADPYNLAAVGRVFHAKGREPNRSLPLLVSDMLMVEDLVIDVTTRFTMLARRYWPGPLTIIESASPRIPLRVTGQTGRLGLRHAKSAVCDALLEELGQPIIATSANISGSPTGRSGIEVFAMMDGRVDLVLDGGLCAGKGSTTIDITEPYWRVIKEGAIAEKELAELLKGS